MSVAIVSPHQGKALCFAYGDEQITFLRVSRDAKHSRILIKVKPDCEVIVAAAEAVRDDEVIQAVKKRARWIYEQQREFKKQLAHIRPRLFISGESHYYLGKQYVLKVIEAPDDNQGVKLLRGQIEVKVRQKSADRVKRQLADWYKSRAKDVFAKRLDAVLTQALWVNEKPPIRIQSMQTQWGSCSPNGRLTLNPNLVKAPRECVDYVILHELCHIAEHNHSERFWRLLSQVMPNWEKVKSKLDGNAYLFLQS